MENISEILNKNNELMERNNNINENLQNIEDLINTFNKKCSNCEVYDILYKKFNNSINLYNDLEIFNSYTNDKNDAIFSYINKNNLYIGEFYFKNLLLNPLYSTSKLNKRKKTLKKLDKKYYNKIYNKLKIIKETECDILWLISKQDETEDSQQLFNMVYFNEQMVGFLNKYEILLNVLYFYNILLTPLINIVSPICAYLVPYIILKCTGAPVTDDFLSKMLNTTLNFDKILFPDNPSTSYMKYIGYIMCIFTYLQTLYSTVKIAYDTYYIGNIIHNKVTNICKFLSTSYELNELVYDLFNDKKILCPIPDIFNPICLEEPRIFTNKGKILYIFKLLLEHRFDFLPIIYYIGKIDAFTSILTLKKKYKLSSVQFIDNVSPILEIDDVYHPRVEQPVYNSITINKEPFNQLITGPNASGKSTYLKSVALNILFAQTLTYSFSSKMKITPFQYFNTYLNIPDCEGKESLFEAEMHRMANELKIITEEKGHVFLIMDEIFSSTNPKEAISGAYSICYNMGEFKNLISLVTTHYDYLTNLEKDTKNWSNYKFTGEIRESDIKYKYKIEDGISNQSFALKILEFNKFNKSIINIANNIYNKI